MSEFDEIIPRVGTNSSKWDNMEKTFGVSPKDGLAMWVADMDFRAPDFLNQAVMAEVAKANYGYFTGLESFYEANCWWQENRHGWKIDPSWILTTYGLGNAIAMALQVYSAPGDHVAIFTPVYHEFAIKISNAGRKVTELPLAINDGLYVMDFAAYEARMTGREKILLISSPHNPAGRVWSRNEMAEIAAFCEKHDLLLISDDIHADLVLPGHSYVPLPVAVPGIEPRLIMLTSASKTFNLAGTRTGCVVIPNAALRARFDAFHRSLNMAPNLFGVTLMRAAYSPEGAAWVDRLVAYLDGNYRLFKDGIDRIPGVTAMPMQSTYLAWVNFEGTGLSRQEMADRIYKTAKIAATPGHTLGTGGETYMRFNLGMPRTQIGQAVDRMQRAFADLQ